MVFRCSISWREGHRKEDIADAARALPPKTSSTSENVKKVSEILWSDCSVCLSRSSLAYQKALCIKFWPSIWANGRSVHASYHTRWRRIQDCTRFLSQKRYHSAQTPPVRLIWLRMTSGYFQNSSWRWKKSVTISFKTSKGRRPKF